MHVLEAVWKFEQKTCGPEMSNLLALELVGKNVALKNKYGGLGLVDLEEAKTSFLCKWIVKAMEPRESNLQLMLTYRLARFNPQRRQS